MRLRNLESALFLMISMLLIASPALAQFDFDLQKYLGSGFDVDALAQFMLPGIPADWLRVPQVLWYIIVPFITVFTVIYGMMRELRIFRHNTNKVYVVLSFCFAMLLLPSGILTSIVIYLYAFGAAFAAIVFGVVFMLGVVLWGVASGWRWVGDVNVERAYARNANNLYKDLKGLRREKIRLIQDLRTANASNRIEIERKIARIDLEMNSVDEKLKTLRRVV